MSERMYKNCTADMVSYKEFQQLISQQAAEKYVRCCYIGV